MTMRSRATLALTLLAALALAVFVASAAFGGGSHCSSSAAASGDHCASHMAAAAAGGGGDDCAMHKASSAKSAAMAAECAGGTCVVLNVSGMHCGHCDTEVEQALMKVKGVKAASADFSTGEAMVVLSNPSTPAKNLIKAVKKAGFRAEVKVADAPEKTTS